MFIHSGPATEAIITCTYLFQTRLPASAYWLDERPHFAVMGEKDKNEDPGFRRRDMDPSVAALRGRRVEGRLCYFGAINSTEGK